MGKQFGLTIRFALVQTVAIAAFTAAWWQGWPQFMFESDVTYLTAAIASLAVVGVMAEGAGYTNVTTYLIEGLPRYGLFGTVVGIAIVAANSQGDFHAILGGMSTAFFTTIAGLMGAEWLRLTQRLR